MTKLVDMSDSPRPGDLPHADHSLTDCWCPQYHASTVSERTWRKRVALFLDWYGKKFPIRRSGPITAVPLCVFGGVQFSRYAHRHHANGTYAVCTECDDVSMVGFGPNGPERSCHRCRADLPYGVYLQPVYAGTRIAEADRLDPATDIRVAVAEAAATSHVGLPLLHAHQFVVLLCAKELLASRDRLSPCVDLAQAFTAMRGSWNECDWLDIAPTTGMDLVVTPLGRIMLDAKGLVPSDEASQYVKTLRSMPDEYRRALAQKHLAELTLARFDATSR